MVREPGSVLSRFLQRHTLLQQLLGNRRGPALLKGGGNESSAANKLVAIGIWCALAAITLGVHHSALQGWWRSDDPQILKHAIGHTPWEYFFIPHVWHELTAANLTPWGTLSFDIDVTLFGLNPQGFYFHHVLVLWLVAGATFTVLRLWADDYTAGLASALFLVGAPVIFVSQQLMTRHYLEGLLFTAVALYLFTSSVRTSQRGMSWWGALFYLLAVTAKEVYVPLILVLPFLPEQDFRQRLRATTPYSIAAGAYLLWRWYMLGGPLGGYVPAERYGESVNWNELLMLPVNGAIYIFGSESWALAVPLIALLLLGHAAWRRPQVIISICAIGLAVMGPLIPLAASSIVNISDRYFFVPWWTTCLMIALAGTHLPRARIRIGLLILLFGLFFVPVFLQGQATYLGLRGWFQEYETQGQFIWNNDFRKVMFATQDLGGGFWYASGLLSLRQFVNSTYPAPRIVVDEIELEQVDIERAEVWAYADTCVCMRDITVNVPEILSRWRSKRQLRPLFATFHYHNRVLSWTLGPHQSGEYRLVDGSYLGRLPFTPVGQRILAIPRRTYTFYIRYDSTEGWVTYSDLLRVDFALSQEVSWSR